MIFRSCHFLCHQFTQRDELAQIVADMDGDIAHIVFCKSDVDKHPCHRGITSEMRQGFCKEYRYMVSIDFVQRGLKAGTVKS